MEQAIAVIDLETAKVMFYYHAQVAPRAGEILRLPDNMFYLVDNVVHALTKRKIAGPEYHLMVEAWVKPIKKTEKK